MRILPHDNDSGAFFVTLLRKKAPVTFAPPHGLEADLTTAAAPPAPAGGDAVEHAQTAELRSANSGAEGSTGDVEDKTVKRMEVFEAQLKGVASTAPTEKTKSDLDVRGVRIGAAQEGEKKIKSKLDETVSRATSAQAKTEYAQTPSRTWRKAVFTNCVRQLR